MKVIINENQRGFLFKDGRYIRLLGPGRYNPMFGRTIEVVQLEHQIASSSCSLDVLLKDEQIASQSAVVDVRDEQLALHFVDGKFNGCIRYAKKAFWNIHEQHDFKILDISSPEVSPEVPRHILGQLPPYYYIKAEVADYQKARLYFDSKFIRLLDAGTYYFWKNSVKVEVIPVDTRMTQMNITGQEILTQDKVSLRINFVCNYRITDYIRVFTEIDDYKEQLHIAAQLALREYVGRYRIDEILENKEQISSFVLGRLKEKEKALYIEITDAGVKDIILPGEIRDIMNTVLIAEKRAQANVITRREEVASTRSLLNTAKLMDENQTLYKLKELEYLEKICERVGSISVSGSGDILSQLAAAVKGTK